MKIDQIATNHVIIWDDLGNKFLNSYGSIIYKRDKSGKITLDVKYWDYSKTTGKFRNLVLNETKRETQAKINSGEYALENLN